LLHGHLLLLLLLCRLLAHGCKLWLLLLLELLLLLKLLLLLLKVLLLLVVLLLIMLLLWAHTTRLLRGVHAALHAALHATVHAAHRWPVLHLLLPPRQIVGGSGQCIRLVWQCCWYDWPHGPHACWPGHVAAILLLAPGQAALLLLLLLRHSRPVGGPKGPVAVHGADEWDKTRLRRTTQVAPSQQPLAHLLLLLLLVLQALHELRVGLLGSSGSPRGPEAHAAQHDAVLGTCTKDTCGCLHAGTLLQHAQHIQGARPCPHLVPCLDHKPHQGLIPWRWLQQLLLL
jgi:hypothetical protein